MFFGVTSGHSTFRLSPPARCRSCYSMRFVTHPRSPSVRDFSVPFGPFSLSVRDSCGTHHPGMLPLFGCYPFVTPFESKNGEKVGRLRTKATCQRSMDSPDSDVLCSALHPHNLRNISAFSLIIQSLSHWADSNRRPTHYEGFSEIENQQVARGKKLDVTQKVPQIIKN